MVLHFRILLIMLCVASNLMNYLNVSSGGKDHPGFISLQAPVLHPTPTSARNYPRSDMSSSQLLLQIHQVCGLSLDALSVCCAFFLVQEIYQQMQTEEGDTRASRTPSHVVAQTRLLLLRLLQQQSYHVTYQLLSSGKTLPRSDPLSCFCPEEQLMKVRGQTNLPHSIKHPVILHHSSHIVKLLCLQVHKNSGDPSLQAILAQDFLITGARRLAKEISKNCVPCQKAYARTKNQLMGQLPPDRATPSPPFSVTGLDFAGPFTTLQGNQRKPTHVKTYICLFVCFSTRAIHLELCSDLSADNALRRFTARRGLPSHIYCDNG